MVELEIDGQKVEVLEGSMVMDAANKLGTYIPHFCYHKKLSIAANCRMCLVQVEKAPKPLPACATPVTQGMKVFTASEQARKAQAGVMEFLLINHPLDCPICDQGGECQLQDLAVGYGGSASRYQEEKRVVFHKNVGPLVSMEEMSRCIHCTRCVRFGQEIAGVMELGMLGRGEHSEITSFVGKTVDSELSGNMIDICPVGALTSKPFRYSARTWELSRRRSVSPHDSLGANLVVQVKADRVMRVVPLENDDINECWISDKDRFSYEGLNSEQRLTVPMIKQGGVWSEVDWETALDFVARGLRDVASRHGGASIGTLVAPHATVEEAFLAQKLARGLGSGNVDSRLRRADFSADGKAAGIPWLGMKIAEVSQLDRVLVVGAFLRKDQPLLAQRLRQIARKRAQVSFIAAHDDDQLINLAHKAVVPPSRMVVLLDAVLAALKGGAAEPVAAAMAASLAGGTNVGLFLGNGAAQAGDAAQLQARLQAIARQLGAANAAARVRFGVLGEAANSVGTALAGALPDAGALDAGRMLESQLKAYLVIHAEPALDMADGRLARRRLAAADLSVVMTPFRHSELEADVLLPVAPFTETAGTFVNTEGRAQSFTGVVRPLGETRPAWKVLRVLGNLLGLDGFEYESAEAVRADALPADVGFRLGNEVDVGILPPAAAPGAGFERVADVPIYFADPLVRRAASLQQTSDAKAPVARLNPADLAALGVASGGQVRVSHGDAQMTIAAVADGGVPARCVRLSAGHPLTVDAGPMAGMLSVERA
jgi:NADH-quinone oxidoreductase subunit G